jgi:hypothetical protein
MLQLNWLAIILSGITPMLIGAIWYGPLFGKAWMKEAGMTEESIKNANMGKIYGFATLFSVLLAVGILPYVIHQMHVGSVLQNLGSMEKGSEANLFFNDFIAKYGNEFRTFKHGAFHGLILGIFYCFTNNRNQCVF